MEYLKSISGYWSIHEETPAAFTKPRKFCSLSSDRPAHALVIFDHDGSGQEERDASDLVSDLQSRLSKGGWNDRAEVIVVEPELEVWVWSESPEVERTLGWSGQSTNLRTWLASRGLWPVDKTKPPRPKEAVEKVLREVRVRRSSSIYRQLAQRVSLERCEDQSFLELKRILRSWFPLEER